MLIGAGTVISKPIDDNLTRIERRKRATYEKSVPIIDINVVVVRNAVVWCYPNVPQPWFLSRGPPYGDRGMGMRGVWQGTTLFVDDCDYETKYDETDGNEGKDEGRSVCRAERAIVISPGVAAACRLGARGWGSGRIGLEVTSVLIVVGHERG